MKCITKELLEKLQTGYLNHLKTDLRHNKSPCYKVKWLEKRMTGFNHFMSKWCAIQVQDTFSTFPSHVPWNCGLRKTYCNYFKCWKFTHGQVTFKYTCTYMQTNANRFPDVHPLVSTAHPCVHLKYIQRYTRLHTQKISSLSHREIYIRGMNIWEKSWGLMREYTPWQVSIRTSTCLKIPRRSSFSRASCDFLITYSMRKVAQS